MRRGINGYDDKDRERENSPEYESLKVGYNGFLEEEGKKAELLYIKWQGRWVASFSSALSVRLASFRRRCDLLTGFASRYPSLP